MRSLLVVSVGAQLAPDIWDCIISWVFSVLFWALLSAIIPGAAVIQHFTLRFILWSRGLIPWRYSRFLDYATERMFLQRIGGRYRFIHDLLRDHFAASELDRQRVSETFR